MRKVLFPEVKSFDELFSEWDTYRDATLPRWEPIPLDPENTKPYPEETIGEYCQGPNFKSLAVRPKPEVIEAIRGYVVTTDAGPMFFKLVNRAGGKTLVVCSYNSIIGSMWLAEVDTSSLPALVQKETRR